MRSPKQQTWGWSEILAAVGETDAALRRKLQRKQIELEADADEGRTRATIWDIARLRVSRHLCDIGFDAERAFLLAKTLVDRAYKDLMSGNKTFTESAGKKQKFLFIVFFRVGATPGGGQVIEINPDNLDEQKSDLAELGLQAFDPKNVVVPIHKLVLDAWRLLPNLPGEIDVWISASRQKMINLLGEAD